MITEQTQPVLEAGPGNGLLAEQIAASWQDVLRKPPSSPDDDFFDVGGNSMLLLAMLELIQRRAGVEIQLADLSEGVTFARITHLAQSAAPVD